MDPHRISVEARKRVYLAAVIAAGATGVGLSARELLRTPPDFHWLILAALTLIAAWLSTKVPTLSARISVSEAFVFASVLAFGPAVATIVVALEAVVVTLRLPSERRSFIRALFNISAGSTAIWSSAHLFELLVDQAAGTARLEALLFPTVVLALSYFGISSWLIAIALSLERQTPAAPLWRRNFLWLSLNYLGGASVALLVVDDTRALDVTALSVVIPLLVITYLTLRTSLGRLEDAQHHVGQLNELYLSTVEALAMAVDAKDQITHGHIRRVQVYTLELAKRLGVRDEQQLKAIETAALLHDMGKLAIPEHILNKPGKLTATEFDRMKRHADIGADLLSSIRFPYPVVPIVRYHHENWDGTGYPARISGTDIPLGARILSVVDCFDALTSDRPYRPRLSNEAAFDILRQRRGTMYDPLVVDTFIRSFSEISPAAIRAGQEARSILGDDPARAGAPEVTALQQIRANASEAALLSECSASLGQAASRREACEVAVRFLRQLTPATVYALYRYDPHLDALTCELAVGDHHHLLQGLTIRLGERITGWCGANLQTAVNSDAALDLMQIAAAFQPPLESAMSTPLTHEGRLVGALTAYSARESAFADLHRYAFEQVAALLGDRLAPASSAPVTVVSFRAAKVP